MTGRAIERIVLTMSGKPNTVRRSERRQETKREIVQASWDVVREHGLAGLSMRDLGERVGMRAQSILPMGSLYEGAIFVLFEAMVLRLREQLGISPEAMRANHTNLE